MRHLIAIVLLVGGLLPAATVHPATAATLVDLSIGTADVRSGQSLTGACYVIVDWSEEGCDENGDGEVDFKGVPHGRYALVETRTPVGYRTVLGLAPLISRPVGGGIQYLSVDHLHG